MGTPLCDLPHVLTSLLLFCYHTSVCSQKAACTVEDFHFMPCCPYSLNILENDFLHHNRNTYKYLGDDTENLNTSAILSTFKGKNIPDPAPAEKQLAETSPKTGGSNSLELNLLHAWAATGTRKCCARFCWPGCENKKKKEEETFFEPLLSGVGQAQGLSSSSLKGHCWPRPGWTRYWTTE